VTNINKKRNFKTLLEENEHGALNTLLSAFFKDV